MLAVGAVVFAALVAAAAAAGPAAVAAITLVAALVALLDASLLFGRAGTRVILPVAVIPGVVLPLLAVLDGGGTAGGWGRIGELFAVAVVGGFILVLVFGRRRDVVTSLGASLAAGLLVGLGAASLVLLHPLGTRWMLVLAALVATADAAAGGAERLAARRGPVPEGGQGGWLPLAVTLGVMALLAAGAVLLLEPPLAPGVATILAAAVAVAVLGGEHLRRSLVAEAGPGGGWIGGGRVLAAVDGLLLSAPVAYVLARTAVL